MGFCGASEQEAGAHVTCRFGAESSIILKFIALRVEARGKGPRCPYYRGRECTIFGISGTKRTVRNERLDCIPLS